MGTYHCFSRCVRRAFLAGVDLLSGEDYSYRKEWVRERLELLAGVFTVEVLDHAVMENHIHTILRNRPDLAKKLRKREVVERWLRLSRKSLKLNPPPKAEEVEEVLEDKRRVRELRRRLSDISWFMIMLKEPIALKANLEDDMSGHFWAEREAEAASRAADHTPPYASTSPANRPDPLESDSGRRTSCTTTAPRRSATARSRTAPPKSAPTCRPPDSPSARSAP